VGYTNRHLGNYDAALSAYEQALALRPGYPDALEYRGEAFLGLNRIADAKQAYLDCSPGNRQLADKLLMAMRGWLDVQKTSASADTTAVGEFDKWIQERSAIAGQTAALTRDGGCGQLELEALPRVLVRGGWHAFAARLVPRAWGRAARVPWRCWRLPKWRPLRLKRRHLNGTCPVGFPRGGAGRQSYVSR